MVRVSDGDRGIPVRIFWPSLDRVGWLVWAHGGSWRSGSVAAWHDVCADLARRSRCVVASVEYRLAPRHRHPAALLDVLAVLAWSMTQARAEPGPDAVAVGGDSAGATIAACAALVRRDRGDPLAAQVLAYPPTDPRCRADSYHRRGFPDRTGLIQAWRDYRGPDYRWDSATGLYSTPAEAADLTGVCPAVVAVGGADPVADDVRQYATGLSTAGVPLSYREFPYARHGAFLDPEPTDASDSATLRSWLAHALYERLTAAVGNGPQRSP